MEQRGAEVGMRGDCMERKGVEVERESLRELLERVELRIGGCRVERRGVEVSIESCV